MMVECRVKALVADDKELFGDAVTIYQEAETTCMQRLRQLLAE